MDEEPNRSSRSIRKTNDQRFLWMVILTLVVVGGGLIGFIYGFIGLLTALPFLLIGAALILIPWILFKGLDWFMEWLENRE